MRNDIYLHELTAVGEASVLRAQRRITGCAACTESASRPFESVIREVLEANSMTRYFICCPAVCPKCSSPIVEATKVRCKDGREPQQDSIEEDVVFIDEPTLSAAQSYVLACEYCSDTADVPFDQLLDVVTGCEPTVEYVICRPARCPRCHGEIGERSLVELSLLRLMSQNGRAF